MAPVHKLPVLQFAVVLIAVGTLLCCVLLLVDSARAAPMPTHAPEALNEILAGEEFQPRRETYSAWDKLKQNLMTWAREQYDRFIESFELPSSLQFEDVWFLSYLRSLREHFLGFASFLLLALEEFAELLAAGAVLILFALLLRAFDRGFKVRETTESSLYDSSELLSSILAQGVSIQVLHIARLRFRAFLKEHHQISLAATDREVVAIIPEVHRTLFTRLAAIYEQVIYAANTGVLGTAQPTLEETATLLDQSQ